MSDFLILGGGVMGMLTARELAQAGASVTLVERGLCGRESTWAGGGIVSPLYPWRYQEPVTQLATWSQGSSIHLAQDLLDETGIDPELRHQGLFLVAVDDATEAPAGARRYRRPMEQVDSAFLYRKEKHLKPGHCSALWMPEVASIRNPRLGQALRRSLELHPRVQLVEQAGSASLLLESERVCGVRTELGDYRAGQTVLAAGAWPATLLQQLGIELPVEPVKGQMMLFKAPVGLVNRVVLQGGRYVIPRNDGRILVGSTLERVGFDKQTTTEARESLYRSALEIVPALADYPVEHHWAGLRPGSPEGIPYIGEVPGIRGLHVNAGQFRNGLVLAPASTRLMADLLLKRSPIIDPAPYRLSARHSG
jgi:glycine oxidase